MAGLEQILSSHGQLNFLGKVPPQPGIYCLIPIDLQCRQRTHITVSRIKFKSSGQVKQNLRSCLMRDTAPYCARAQQRLQTEEIGSSS